MNQCGETMESDTIKTTSLQTEIYYLEKKKGEKPEAVFSEPFEYKDLRLSMVISSDV